MKVVESDLPGVRIIEPAVFKDSRGKFMEIYHHERYRNEKIDETFIQDNVSYSGQNTLRGLHYQYPHAQAKLVQVVLGEVFDVAVDIRKGSRTFGKWVGVHLSDTNHRQLFIPKGYAHGFCVLSQSAVFMYKCSDVYHPETEYGILWSDPKIGITWPISQPLLSEKDASYPLLQDVADHRLPNCL